MAEGLKYFKPPKRALYRKKPTEPQGEITKKWRGIRAGFRDKRGREVYGRRKKRDRGRRWEGEIGKTLHNMQGGGSQQNMAGAGIKGHEKSRCPARLSLGQGRTRQKKEKKNQEEKEQETVLFLCQPFIFIFLPLLTFFPLLFS